MLIMQAMVVGCNPTSWTHPGTSRAPIRLEPKGKGNCLRLLLLGSTPPQSTMRRCRDTAQPRPQCSETLWCSHASYWPFHTVALPTHLEQKGTGNLVPRQRQGSIARPCTSGLSCQDIGRRCLPCTVCPSCNQTPCACPFGTCPRPNSWVPMGMERLERHPRQGSTLLPCTKHHSQGTAPSRR